MMKMMKKMGHNRHLDWRECVLVSDLAWEKPLCTVQCGWFGEKCVLSCVEVSPSRFVVVFSDFEDGV